MLGDYEWGSLTQVYLRISWLPAALHQVLDAVKSVPEEQRLQTDNHAVVSFVSSFPGVNVTR